MTISVLVLLCVYLSVNYLNRFLSAYDLRKGKAWMMQLLAVACLSLAAKMEKTKVPLYLQVCESKFVFEERTIQRMELYHELALATESGWDFSIRWMRLTVRRLTKHFKELLKMQISPWQPTRIPPR